MANKVKYQKQVWGEPITGERLSTNGYYTGEHIGRVMQDASVDGTEQPHSVEESTIRYGTMMGDAAVGSMPKKAVAIAQVLTNCKSSYTDKLISKEDNLSITYTATNSKTLPETVTVKIGGVTKTVTTDYTWTKATGVLTIAKAKITGDIEITVAAA